MRYTVVEHSDARWTSVLTAWVMPTWSPAWRERSPVAAALFHQVGSVLVLLNAITHRYESPWWVMELTMHQRSPSRM